MLIENLDRILISTEGLPIKVDTGGHLTLRRTLLILLGAHRCGAPEVFRVYEVATKILAAEVQIDLSEADQAFLSDVVEKSWQVAPFGAFVMAQVIRTLRGMV